MDLAISIEGWISLTILTIAFIISLIHRGKKDLLPIQLYIVVSIILNLFSNILNFLPENGTYKHIGESSVNTHSILEIFFIYTFLYLRIRSIKFRNTMIIFFIFYISICLILWTHFNSFGSFLPDLFGIEGILIIIPSLIYIYEIFKSDLVLDFKSDANFIVTCGILFYFSITTPICFCWYNLYHIALGFNKILIFSISIFFMILIISFMKAYLCPIRNLQQ